MDPGYKLLQHIKTVPNLINEDPSIVTPTNTSFMDLPWSDFSKMLASKKNDVAKGRRSSATSVDSTETSSTHSQEDLGNWDSMTYYQDAQHVTEYNDHHHH